MLPLLLGLVMQAQPLCIVTPTDMQGSVYEITCAGGVWTGHAFALGGGTVVHLTDAYSGDDKYLKCQALDVDTCAALALAYGTGA